MTARILHIPEHAGAGRLGRHVEHDPDSRAFACNLILPPISMKWERHCPPFNQAALGSCTGNAGTGIRMTAPFWTPGLALTEEDAIALYSVASRLDKIPGHYPPDDTGSSGLAVAKAMRRAGWLRAYHHAFGLHSALTALRNGPLMLGINWYEGFDSPVGRNATIAISGDIRGGHEIEVNEVDVEQQLIRFPNSWGEDWGDHGYGTMTFATLERLLSEQGDVVVPVK